MLDGLDYCVGVRNARKSTCSVTRSRVAGDRSHPAPAIEKARFAGLFCIWKAVRSVPVRQPEERAYDAVDARDLDRLVAGRPEPVRHAGLELAFVSARVGRTSSAAGDYS
jgi:hypothetical protein